MQRRRFLQFASLPLLSACGGEFTHPAIQQPALILARRDRIIATRTCLRPFRPMGPRIELERLGPKTIIHNYGHGGSGWSLSWGSAMQALQLAPTTGTKRLAVVGCGAIGLTTALLAQENGWQVRIYAKDLPAQASSSSATGIWSPDSRIVTQEHSTPAFEQRWLQMALSSFERHKRMLGSPGTPVEWRKGFSLSETPVDQIPPHIQPDEPAYPSLKARFLHGLVPPPYVIPREQLPFPPLYAMGYTQLVFNIGILTRQLVDNFHLAGGKIEVREFRHSSELTTVDEEIIVNATGYGARQLFEDASIVPVRGQNVLLKPQSEVDYGLTWRSQNLSVVSRRDGILVQERHPGEFDNADRAVDTVAAEAAVARLAKLYTSGGRLQRL